MRLYLKQHILTLGDSFSVYDENGDEKYFVKGMLYFRGLDLCIYDLEGNPLLFIDKNIIPLFTKYYISRNGIRIAEVVKEPSFLNDIYSVNNLGWTVKGDFLNHQYEITDQYGSIATVSKEWFTLGDGYNIRVVDDVDETVALAVCLIIDACLESRENA